MLVDELISASISLRKMFLPIKKEQYDWKNLEFGGRNYFFNVICNIQHGFQTQLMYDNNVNMLETLYLKDEIIFKHVRSVSKNCFAEAWSVKLFKDDHFYEYLDWNEKIFKEYINFIKLYALERV